MNPNPLPSDDPKLTAYALGELDLEENTRVAQAIKGDPAAQAAVEEIRALVCQMEEALENEPLVPATVFDPRGSSAKQQVPTKVVSFPAYLMAGLAAACVMMIISSRTPSASSDLSQVRSVEAKPVSNAQSQNAETSVLLNPDLGSTALPVVGNRRRAVSEIPDVNPTPLQNDGLDRWRSVADNRDGPATPLALDDGSVTPATEAKSYSPSNYSAPAAEKGLVAVADVSHPATTADHAVTTHYEVVPVAALTPPKVENDWMNFAAQETGLLAGNNPRSRELLKLEIRYKLPALDLSPRITLPRIDTVVDLAFTDKDFKLAVAAAGLDKTLKEVPHKASTYDEILTWNEETSDATEDAAEPRHESIEAVKKPTSATVE